MYNYNAPFGFGRQGESAPGSQEKRLLAPLGQSDASAPGVMQLPPSATDQALSMAKNKALNLGVDAAIGGLTNAYKEAAKKAATNTATNVGTNVAAKSATGATASTMGPLVSGAMNAVQGKWGAAAGSVIGGIAGSTFGPIGTMFGSALGSAIGGGITGENSQPQIAQAPEANQQVPPPMPQQTPPPSYDQHVDDWQQSVGGFASGFADGGFVIGPTPPPAPDFVIGPTNPNTSTQTQGSNDGGFVIGPTPPPAPVPSPAPSPAPSPNTQQPTTGKGVTDTTPSPVAQQPTAGKGVAGTTPSTGFNMPQNGIPGIGAQFGQGPSSMFYRGPYYGELNQAWDPIAAGQAQLLSTGFQPRGFLTPPQGSVPTTGGGTTGTTKPTGGTTGGTNTGTTQPNSSSSDDPNSSGIWMAGRYTPIPPKNPEKEGYTQILQYPETGDSGWMAQWDYVPNDLYEKQQAWHQENEARMRELGGGT